MMLLKLLLLLLLLLLKLAQFVGWRLQQQGCFVVQCQLALSRAL